MDAHVIFDEVYDRTAPRLLEGFVRAHPGEAHFYIATSTRQMHRAAALDILAESWPHVGSWVLDQVLLGVGNELTLL